MTQVVVVGDSLLDVDLEGRAERLCPDAPVPVLDHLEEQVRPGGAALAALLAARSGHAVTLVTAWGDDEAGERLLALLEPELHVVRVPGGGATPVKRRVRAGGHPLLRLDHVSPPKAYAAPAPEGVDALGAADAVLVSDYGRGLTAGEPVRRALAGRCRVPLVWDPHPRGCRPVPGATVVTPNAAELDVLVAREPDEPPDLLRSRVSRAARLGECWETAAVAVTLGEHGALMVPRGGTAAYVPAPKVVPGDTCGAGDRFAATVTGALAAGSLPSEAVADAVTAAAAFVAAGGASALNRPADPFRPATATATAGRTVVATGGCFDLLHAGHVACLEAARRLGDRLVVCLNSDASVRRLKGPERPLVAEDDRAAVLRALTCVDEVVVFDEDTPAEVLGCLQPDIWVKGGDYDADSLPEAEVLRSWGGRVVVLPYLPGRSTTDLVRAVRGTPEERSTTR
jgi:rfaE bifunctional protein nucleotidyltransferase chain/domain/rfaE bifunctional protein kinase chain/domain